MAAVAFDTSKLAQRLEADGLPGKQAQEVASALSETIGEAVVTREYLDLRLAELDPRLAEVAAQLEGKIAELRTEILKWMFGNGRAADPRHSRRGRRVSTAFWPLISAPDARAEDRDDRNGEAVRSAIGGSTTRDCGLD